jgi:hypothetical protein
MRFAAVVVGLVLGIWSSVCLSSAVARDIFVNNVLGDDRRGGTMAAVGDEGTGPCRSIAKALRIACPGDHIVVANTGQPYRESITVQGPRHSGIDRFPTIIRGNGATLDGSMSMAEVVWEFAGDGMFRTRPIAKSFQQVFLAGAPLVRRQPLVGEFPKLAAREWCLFRGWIYFGVDAGRLPEDYELSCCGEQVGITLYNVHDLFIEDLNVRGFWLDGVNCHDNVSRADLLRISAKENGRSGFSVGGWSKVRIDTSSAAGNGAAQVRLEGVCQVQLLDTVLDETTAPAVVREGGRIVAGE